MYLLRLYLVVTSAQTRDGLDASANNDRDGDRDRDDEDDGSPFLSLLRRLFAELLGGRSSWSDHIVRGSSRQEKAWSHVWGQTNQPDSDHPKKMTALLTRNTFRQLVDESVSADTIDHEYEVILRAYDGDRARHYHTMTHIHAMWAAWDDYCHSQSIRTRHSDKVVRLAIIFHECGVPNDS